MADLITRDQAMAWLTGMPIFNWYWSDPTNPAATGRTITKEDVIAYVRAMDERVVALAVYMADMRLGVKR